MSTVNANVRLGYQNAGWFTTNASVVLLSGQIVYRSTDGKYIIGDGVTAISGLTFYGGVSSSGLTTVTETYTVTGTTQAVAHTPLVVYSVTMNGQFITEYSLAGSTFTFTNAMASDKIDITYAY